jgi:hypothetical protein
MEVDRCDTSGFFAVQGTNAAQAHQTEAVI